MIKMMKWLAAMLLAAIVAACGGGGGSPGLTSNGGGTGTGGTTLTPTLTLTLVNSSDGAVANNTITNSATVFAKAVVKDRRARRSSTSS